jgi:lipopolysaccharide export LptBFGC system permease protein LptF
MWRLHRYYLKEVLINAAITFLVLFAVVAVSFIYQGVKRSQGGGLLDAFLIIVFFALDSFQHLLTISFLLATVLVFTRAAQDRELTAIRAAGISPRVPMTAALLIGLFLTALGSFALHYLIPEVHFRKYRVIADVVRNAVIGLGLGSDRIKYGDFGMTFGEVRTDPERRTAEYRDCVLYLPRRTAARFSAPIVFVDSVSIPQPREGSESLSIVLEGVRDPVGGTAPSQLTLTIPLDELGNQDRRQDRDDDLRSDQLLAEVVRGVHQRPNEAIYTLFRRCCFSLMPLLLAPIGYCIAEAARDRGRVMALVLSLLPLGLFYLGEVLGARLLLTTKWPGWGWLPAMLLVAVGLPLCWRQLRR